jgi:hypothetical protein
LPNAEYDDDIDDDNADPNLDQYERLFTSPRPPNRAGSSGAQLKRTRSAQALIITHQLSTSKGRHAVGRDYGGNSVSLSQTDSDRCDIIS